MKMKIPDSFFPALTSILIAGLYPLQYFGAWLQKRSAAATARIQAAAMERMHAKVEKIDATTEKTDTTMSIVKSNTDGILSRTQDKVDAQQVTIAKQESDAAHLVETTELKKAVVKAKHNPAKQR
jgi:hypothetical protein